MFKCYPLRWMRMHAGQVTAQKFVKSKVTVHLSALFNLATLVIHLFMPILPSLPQFPTTSKPFTMPPKTTVAQSQIKTRAKNKESHPEIPDQASPCQTSVKVESECVAKAQATTAWQEKKQQNI